MTDEFRPSLSASDSAELSAAEASGRMLKVPRKAESAASIVWRNFRRNKFAVAGGIVVILLYLVAIFANQLAPHNYAAFNPGQPLKAPSAAHWFGTDRQTRDILSRVIVGSRVSLSVGFVAVLLIMLIGISFGAIAGYFGGFVDNLIMRFTDIMLAIPGFFLLITAAALFTPGLRTTMIVIGLTSWMSAARLVRGEFLRVKAQDFILAARSVGVPNRQIIIRHILPNVLAVIIVEATLWLSYAILLESGLSFLGLGAQPPTPSWGGMLADGRVDMQSAWWETVFPGLAIFITVFAFNLVGDGLRDAFDPRQHRK